MRIEDMYYTGILRKKAKLNMPKGLAESKWNTGHEKETMCLHRGGITYEAMIRQLESYKKSKLDVTDRAA